MTSDLARRECKSCDGEISPLKGEALRKMQAELDGGWKVLDDQRLEKKYTFADFRHALDFTNRIGEIAEKQGHHPDIYLAYGEVRVQVWTHKIQGLTESDFILAAKISELG